MSAAVPVRRLDARVRKVGDTLVVGRAEDVFELDEVAAFVWRQIDGERTVADLGAVLAVEYDIDAAEAAGDVADMLEPLVAHGLITMRD